MAQYANAYPRKRFFLEMFTRDIALEDCILDLVDNSIDSLVRSRDLDLSKSALELDEAMGEEPEQLPLIKVQFSTRQFSITDSCGGIPWEDARDDVFNFGHPPAYADASGRRQLGAYGIGLKRAIFKIGGHLTMRSNTPTDGFEVDLDIDKWAESDNAMKDWRIPISRTSGSTSAKSSGTSVVVKRLRDEVKMRIADSEFEQKLHTDISKTYAFFLGREVRVELNGNTVKPFPIPIGGSDEVSAAYDVFEQDGVRVTLIASLASRDPQGRWKAESAGWYVMCNGRAIVVADKSELTGWGGGALPLFQPKYRGFLGLAFFESRNPLNLPWTTTKRGLNRESPIYQSARNRMRGLGRPIITFLDGMYRRSEPIEEPEERRIAESIKDISIRDMVAKEMKSQPMRAFDIKRAARSKKKRTLRIQFDAGTEELSRIRKHLRKPRMSGTKIGEHVFEYFLKAEGLEQ